FSILRRPPSSTPFPYTTLFRSHVCAAASPRKVSPRAVFFSGCTPVVQPSGEMKMKAFLKTALAAGCLAVAAAGHAAEPFKVGLRSEEHTSELQSRENLVCRLLL